MTDTIPPLDDPKENRDDDKEEDFYWRLYGALKPIVKFWARPKALGNAFATTTDGPVLLACNHTGHLWWDSLTLLACFPHRKVHVAGHYWDASVAPIRGFFNMVDATYIKKEVTEIEAEDEPVTFLKDGKAVLMYPEESYHTFKNRYTTFKFSPHIARYAELSGAPIVPVAMIGVEEAAPCFFGYKKSGVPLHFTPLGLVLPFTVRAEFGSPVTYAELIEGAPEDLTDEERWQYAADRLQEQMHALVTMHKPKRAKMSDQRYIEHKGWT